METKEKTNVSEQTNVETTQQSNEQIKTTIDAKTIVDAINNLDTKVDVIKNALRNTNNAIIADVKVSDKGVQMVKFFALEARKQTFTLQIGNKTIDSDNSILSSFWLQIDNKVKVGDVVTLKDFKGIKLFSYSKSFKQFFAIVRPFKDITELNSIVEANKIAKVNNKLQPYPMITINIGSIYKHTQQNLTKFIELIDDNNIDSFVNTCNLLGIDAYKYIGQANGNDIMDSEIIDY